MTKRTTSDGGGPLKGIGCMLLLFACFLFALWCCARVVACAFGM